MDPINLVPYAGVVSKLSKIGKVAKAARSSGLTQAAARKAGVMRGLKEGAVEGAVVGGAMGAGLQMTGTYYLDDNWSLAGGISYEKLLNDAADSPITMRGSDDQWRVEIGLSRQFTLNF